MAALYPAADISLSPHGLPTEPPTRIGFLNSEKSMLLESPRYGDLPSGDAAVDIDGILHLTIHHAFNIHNICIYGNQDVYAKFSIAHCQDAVYSTQPVKAGGKNPVFNQSLQIPISRADSVLKCEIWMMSCVRNYLQDQLLGFVLVSLGSLFGKGKQTQDYSLTSTDLFYTPAGTVCLSLLFRSSREFLQHEVNGKMFQDSSLAACRSQSSPDVTMDCGQQILGHDDLSKIEFPDLEAASENQHLVSVYLRMAAGDVKDSPELNGVLAPVRNQEHYYEDGIALENQDLAGAPFLQLGASPLSEVDCEMSSSLGEGEEKCSGASPVLRDSQFLNYASQLGNAFVEAPVSAKNIVPTSSATEHVSAGAAHAPGSTLTNEMLSTDHHLFKDVQPAKSLSSVGGCGHSSAEMEEKDKGVAFSSSQGSEVSAFTAPLVNVSVETDVAVTQQQIVDLYMKSMQQFTEKLAEMKLPLDMEGQNMSASRNMKLEKKGAEEEKTEGQKLFYGSRAFF